MLENVSHKLKKDGIKFCEYHKNTHSVFANFSPKIPILCEEAVRPLILIRQDESCFKQYRFSQKYWTRPSGEMKLLPKSDEYTWMVSAFVSKDFGVGLMVSDEEMKLVNKRRQSGEWNHYVSMEEAIDVYGTSKKKSLKNKHTLIQYFNVEINKEGYWNCNNSPPS